MNFARELHFRRMILKGKDRDELAYKVTMQGHNVQFLS
jgi:hypothetical protein